MKYISSFAITLLCLIALITSSCVEDQNIGEGLLGDNRIGVHNSVDSIIVSRTVLKNHLNYNDVSTAIIGTLNDKQIGQTHSGCAFQLRMTSPIEFQNAEADSVNLLLTYKQTYGNGANPQLAKVYMLNGDLNKNKIKDPNFNIETILGEELGNATFTKKDIYDTIFWKSKLDPQKDSIVNNKKVAKHILNTLKISLDKEVIGKFITNASSETFSSNDNFVNYLKGLYVKTEPLEASKEGALYSFDIYNTQLQVFYRNIHKENNKTKIDTLRTFFSVTDNSMRINTANFSQANATLANSKEYICLSGLGATKATIEIPALNTWADSTNYAVNSAILSLKVAKDMGNDKMLKSLPQSIALSVVNDKDETYPLNTFGINNRPIVNGRLNKDSTAYTFLIPRLLQNIIKGKDKIKHFKLSIGDLGIRYSVGAYGNKTQIPYTIEEKNTPKRVILHNTGINKPKLDIVYTKE